MIGYYRYYQYSLEQYMGHAMLALSTTQHYVIS